MEPSGNGSVGEPVRPVGEATRHRVVHSAEQWRALIAGQEASGLGVEAYCRQHQLTSSCLYRWRRFFAGAMGAASAWGKPGRCVTSKRRSEPVEGFAAVRVVPEPICRRSVAALGAAAARTPEPSMRLLLAGGRELILPMSMPTPLLAELLAALEAKPSKREREG